MLRTGVILADRYQLDEPIAAGGVGQVWRATDLVLQRPVAVKLLRPEYADHPETLSRFRAEARHAGSLAHPGIAQVYDFGDNPYEGPPYLVMELVDGPSLADVLADEPLTPAYALDVLAKAAIGLGAAHEAGLVHRDIKPGNILLGRDGQVKITDFGIAHAIGSAPVTDPGLVMGTTQYLAPERIAGGSGTPAADMYSLGIVMHECLTGVPPYEGTPGEVMAGHLYVPLPPLPAGTPPEVEDLVRRLTAKDPEQRLCDASELGALARTVRAQISGGPMPRQRQSSALSPVVGVAAPEGLAAPGPDVGSMTTEGIPSPPPSGFPERPPSSFPSPPPNGFLAPAASGFPEPPMAPSGPGGYEAAVIGDEAPFPGAGLGAPAPSDPRLGDPDLADAHAGEHHLIDAPAGDPAPGVPYEDGFGGPAGGGPGTELALRDPGPGAGALAVREPGRTGAVPQAGDYLRETSVDFGSLLETSIDLGGPANPHGPDGRGPRTIHGALIDTNTGPFATEAAFTGGHARPHLAGMRDTGPMLAAGRSHGRRRAAIGIGVLLLAGGAGLTGAAASGVLHPSPVADRTNANAAHPGLSAVQPNVNVAPASSAAPSAPGKHRKPYTAKHSKAAAPAPASSAPARTQASSAASSPASGSPSGPATNQPAPAPSQSTPVCILGVLCSS